MKGDPFGILGGLIVHFCSCTSKREVMVLWVRWWYSREIECVWLTYILAIANNRTCRCVGWRDQTRDEGRHRGFGLETVCTDMGRKGIGCGSGALGELQEPCFGDDRFETHL